MANVKLTNSDWFRLETMDDSLQPTIDMLLNLAVFMWFGAVCPWHLFLDNNVIPIYRLIPLGILILLVRRMPIIFAMHKYIDQIESLFQTTFVGFFGPIGVGAVFYLSVSREYLNRITVNGEIRADAQQVSDTIEVVVWFLVICSIVVHGLSIPFAKAGYHLPRTISQAISTSTGDNEPIPLARNSHTHSTATHDNVETTSRRTRRHDTSLPTSMSRSHTPQPVAFQIGRSVIPSASPSSDAQIGSGSGEEPARPVTLVPKSEMMRESARSE
jgi:NhaP-type Na+/H+ or K+/H+ antiporter